MRIRKFKSTSQFFQHALVDNSGIHTTQQRVKELDYLKLNSSNQERNKLLVITKIVVTWITLMASLKLVSLQIVLTIVLKMLIIEQWKTQ